MDEQWRTIDGFEGLYEVSDYGNVRRIKGGHGVQPYTQLRPRFLRNGYLSACLSRNDIPTVASLSAMGCCRERFG